MMRDLALTYLQYRARKLLSKCPGVEIHPTAKVNCRRVRFRAGSRLIVGEGSIVEASLVSERDGSRIEIGRNTFLGNSIVASAASIEIGDDVLISWGCNIVDHNSHAIRWEHRRNDVKDWYVEKKDWSNVVLKPVKVCDKAWIGLNVLILKGVEVGEGAIVGAGAVVTKSVPPWTICGGNPAKVIREIPIEER